MERTFLMIKPDGVQRNLIGKAISRIEPKGLKIVGLKMMRLTEEKAGEHYNMHKGKPFYGRLVEFITSGVVVGMVVEGKDAIKVVRTLVGKTNGREAAPGTIRGDFGISISNNIVHASDSPETAKAEISRFFTPEELFEYDKAVDVWLYASDEL